MGGALCCTPSQCRQIISTQRCCVQAGQGCTNDLQCCGYMLCQSGMCACQGNGRSCQDSNECCSGFTCQNNVCRPGAAMDGGVDAPRADGATDGATGDLGMCVRPGQSCQSDAGGAMACCAGYMCGTQPNGSRTCCRGPGSACSGQLDCCGNTLCISGMCRCRNAGETCMANTDCCTGNDCRNGMCTPAMCLSPGARCDMGATSGDGGTGDGGAPMQCCNGYLCNPQPSGNRTCCRRAPLTTTAPTVSCMTGADCCGFNLCQGGNCVCRRDGEPCLDNVDCCGAMLCNRAMGATQGTCRCQARGQLCYPNGNDCCAGTTCNPMTQTCM